MLKTLSLVLTDEVTDAPALAAAAALASREDAALDVICLAVEPVPLETVSMGAVGLVSQFHDDALAQADALAAWARRALPEGVRASVEPVSISAMGLMDSIARLARFSDLSVVSRPYGAKHGPLAGQVAETLLFGTAAPVLVAPDEARDWSQPFRRIAVAWNGSDEALRAVRAALPFLVRAERVDIVMVDPPHNAPDRSDPGGALSHWLSRHGIRCELSVLGRGQAHIGEVLTAFAVDRGADAMVMGAYTHSRLREAVLGGATREMLSAVPLPLIMAR